MGGSAAISERAAIPRPAALLVMSADPVVRALIAAPLAPRARGCFGQRRSILCVMPLHRPMRQVKKSAYRSARHCTRLPGRQEARTRPGATPRGPPITRRRPIPRRACRRALCAGGRPRAGIRAAVRQRPRCRQREHSAGARGHHTPADADFALRNARPATIAEGSPGRGGAGRPIARTEGGETDVFAQ